MKNIIVILTLLYSVQSFSELVKIRSNPDIAEVYVKNTITGKKVKIGKTPLSIDMGEIVNNYAGSEVFVIEIEKDGYEVYRLLIGQVGQNEIDLIVNLSLRQDIALMKNTDFLIGELFDIQRQIRTKDYENAIGRLVELEKKFPNFSVIYELIASAYYLNQKFKEALSYYRKAFSVNPDNRDAYIMKNYLERKFNLTAEKGT